MVKSDIQLLEKVTGKKVLLKENVFQNYIASTKKPIKAVKELIDTLTAMENMERIPERDFRKVESALQKLTIPIIGITTVATPGSFPALEKFEAELKSLNQKYKGDGSYYSISTKVSPQEKARVEKLRDDPQVEIERKNRYAVDDLSSRYGGKFSEQISIPYKTWVKLKEAGASNPTSGFYNFSIYHLYFKQRTEGLVGAFQKGIEILTKDNQLAAVQAYQKNLNEINRALKFVDALNQLKLKVESSKAAKMREKEAAMKGSVNPVILKHIQNIGEDFRKIIEQNQYSFLKNRLNEFIEISKGETQVDLYILFPINYIETKIQTRRGPKIVKEDVNQYKRNKYEEVTVTIKGEGYPNYQRIVKAKTDADIREMAIKYSHEQIAPFILKMSDKLGGLFSDINVLVDVEKLFDKSSVSNTLLFKINNGESRFILQNQIVRHTSNLGTPFYRFPTTFHAGIVKGKKVDFPDEESVKRTLNAAYQ